MGPRCAKAEQMLGALAYVFHVSAGAAQEPGLVDRTLGSGWTALETAKEMLVRGAETEPTIDFDALFPDAIGLVCSEANLPAPIIEEGLTSEVGYRTLLGTKVPEGAAFRLNARFAELGLEFGALFAAHAKQAAANDQAKIAAFVECAGAGQEWYAADVHEQGLALGKIWLRDSDSGV